MQIESIVDTSTNQVASNPTTYTISSQQPTNFEMINENELPVLIEVAEETVMMRSEINRSDEILYQTMDMNEPVASSEIPETAVEAMLVDNDTNQLNLYSEGEPSTPERPSGPSLEEPLLMHDETEQSYSPSEECLVLTRHNDEDYSIRTDEDLICEAQVSGQNIHATSKVKSVNYEEQPSTPERSSDPSLEEQFQDSVLHSTLAIGVNTVMDDSEVESFNPIEAFESLEDLTVYEVVTEYRESQPTSTTNYPRVFLHCKMDK